jgi:hypothetical protein
LRVENLVKIERLEAHGVDDLERQVLRIVDLASQRFARQQEELRRKNAARAGVRL